MTKIEMVNRMIILGCIEEEDRNYYIEQTIEELTSLYITIVPIRLAYLGRI